MHSKPLPPAFIGTPSSFLSFPCHHPYRHASFLPYHSCKLFSSTQPSRRAKFFMNTTSDNNNNNTNNNISNNNNNTEDEEDQEQEQQEQQEQQQHAQPSSSSSSNNSKLHFDQDTLRQRIANLDTKKDNNSNNRNDVTIFSDSTNYYVEEDDSAEIEEDSINENEALEFIDTFNNIKKVWVILFTNVKNGMEGVYSLTVGDQNIVLAFEEKYEAHRYVISLEAQKFPQPQVVEMDANKMKEFCNEGNLKLGFVPKGKVIIPPEQSVIDDLDTWRGKPSSGRSDSTGMSQDDIDTMRERLDSLFGQQ